MKTIIITAVIVSIFAFAGCGITVSLNPAPSNDCNEKYNQCEQCKIQPRSGNNRDLRYGSYYDTEEKNVKKQLIQPEMDVYHPLSKRWKNVKLVVVICNSL